jgi:transcriptional antiterminator RfaH
MHGNRLILETVDNLFPPNRCKVVGMPILKEECSLFPDTLLDDASCGEADRRWFALYTRARQEKSLARELLIHQIPFYLPLVRKTSASRGRKRTSLAPIFGGYVFLFGSEEERVRTLATNRISRILTVEDADQLVFDLRQLRQLIAVGAPLTVESRLAPGQRVRVRQGAFAGLEGTVLKRRGETRLLVSINFLQRGASVEIDDFLLEPLD